MKSFYFVLNVGLNRGIPESGSKRKSWKTLVGGQASDTIGRTGTALPL